MSRAIDQQTQERIEQLRRNEYLTQQVIAERVGVTTRCVRKYLAKAGLNEPREGKPIR